jgi:DNA modification methylase
VIATDQNWPAFNVERRAVSALRGYDKNARTHSAEQIDQLVASIREWGWTQPILVDETDMVVAGHGRLAAAQKLGIAEVPVIVATGWSEQQKRAYALADNQLALNAGWDMDLLKVEIAELQVGQFDVGLMGFGEGFLADLFATKAGKTEPDDIPDVPANAVTQAGDVWLLGDHRIICGDSTDPAVVGALLGDVKPHLMVTDPPYGVEYDPTRTSNNKAKAGKVLNDDRADWTEAWAVFPGDVAYVWHASMFTTTVLASLETCGFKHRSMIIWAKDRMTLGRGDYHWQHEPCWYVVREGKTGHWVGGRDKTTVWNIKAREDAGHGHGTQKPVECMKRPIENNSQPGDAVYEPFSGSGTTIIAGEMTGRRVHAVELNPVYVDVAVKRWQAFTGKQAVLAGTDKSFEDVADERYDWRKDGLGS